MLGFSLSAVVLRGGAAQREARNASSSL
ncbi:hypothetical protein AB0G12_33860 [Nonomuraea dietziae]